MQQVIFGPEPTAETSTRWCFVSRDKRESVVLTDDFIVYETTSYEVFDTFSRRVKDILTELNGVADIGFASQIGLRYVDVITALDGHSPSWFIREQLQGLTPNDVEAKEVVNQFLSVITTNDGQLKLKSLEGRGPRFMPPDLEATRLEFELKLNDGEQFRILDFDHIWKGEMDFGPDELVRRMDTLHEGIKQTFKAAVTPEAITVWKKGEVE